ncbi:hypothetical protein C8R45DRAFT_923064 [Mycena sanguinolenta]|nr:hypothetical protein C8R45DRAFT_923064 [Mycena sanguinolenta]
MSSKLWYCSITTVTEGSELGDIFGPPAPQKSKFSLFCSRLRNYLIFQPFSRCVERAGSGRSLLLAKGNGMILHNDINLSVLRRSAMNNTAMFGNCEFTQQCLQAARHYMTNQNLDWNIALVVVVVRRLILGEGIFLNITSGGSRKIIGKNFLHEIHLLLLNPAMKKTKGSDKNCRCQENSSEPNNYNASKANNNIDPPSTELELT